MVFGEITSIWGVVAFSQVFISPNAGAVASGGFFDYETDVRRTMNLRLVATDRVRETTQNRCFSIVLLIQTFSHELRNESAREKMCLKIS